MTELEQVRAAMDAREAKRREWDGQVEMQRREEVARRLRLGDGAMMGVCLCDDCLTSMLRLELPNPRTCDRARAWAAKDRCEATL